MSVFTGRHSCHVCMYFCVFTGGGFGGKETRTAVLVMPAAVAAYK